MHVAYNLVYAIEPKRVTLVCELKAIVPTCLDEVRMCVTWAREGYAGTVLMIVRLSMRHRGDGAHQIIA